MADLIDLLPGTPNRSPEAGLRREIEALRAKVQELEQPSPRYAEWSEGKTYRLTDVVVYQNKKYVCIARITNYPPTERDSWAPYEHETEARTEKFPLWNAHKNYAKGDIVEHDRVLWVRTDEVSTKSVNGSLPPGRSLYWEVYSEDKTPEGGILFDSQKHSKKQSYN